MVVEAKGGTSPLGTRMMGRIAAMQGTRPYVEKIVELMRSPKQTTEARQAAVEPGNASDRDAVTYLEVRTPVQIGSQGRTSSPSVVVHAFDLGRAQP